MCDIYFFFFLSIFLIFFFFFLTTSSENASAFTNELFYQLKIIAISSFYFSIKVLSLKQKKVEFIAAPFSKLDLPQLPFLVVGIKKVFAKVFNYLFLINLLNNSFFSFTSKPAFPIFLQICEITFSQKILQDFNLEFSFLIIKIESSYEKKEK